MSPRPQAILTKLAIALASASALLAAGCAGAAGADGGPATTPLWATGGGGFTPVAGKVDPRTPCQLMSVSLAPARGGAAPKLFGAPSPCHAASLYIGDLRGTLFIEGVDAAGGRLFVAAGLNPLHQDVETPPSSPGPGMSWRAVDGTAPVLTTTIRAPITAALSRLRWYDVDGQDQPHLLGETAWTAPATTGP